SDTGVGIPAQELPHLFKRFHRVQNTRARSYEGTGIGLALVHELVKLHGGSIEVESKLDQGTTFTIRIPFGKDHLPAERINAQSQQASTALSGDVFIEEALRWMPLGISISAPGAGTLAAPAQKPDHAARVLVAEDNADMRDYVGRLLEGRYQLEVTRDGQEALEAARRNKPDLIVSDLMMPRLGGFALLKAVREDPALKTVPVILLSARAGAEALVEGIEREADDYLVKPFTARE